MKKKKIVLEEAEKRETLNKEKVVSFRIDKESFKDLERMAEKLGAGTAHNFVRELAERVIDRSGAVDAWSRNEAEQTK